MNSKGYADAAEVESFSALGIKLTEWSFGVETAIYLSTHGQAEAARESMDGVIYGKSVEIGQLLERLASVNESQAIASRNAAHRYYLGTIISIAAFFSAFTAGVLILGKKIVNYIVKTSGMISHAAEVLAYGNTQILEADHPDDEIGRIGLAVKKIAGGIHNIKKGIAEQAAAKNEAERANRIKTDLISEISREIRTPLNAIIGMTQIARRTDDYSKLLECVNSIEASSRDLADYMDDIADMPAPDAGGPDFPEDIADLYEIVVNAGALAHSAAQAKKVEIRTQVDIVREYAVTDSRRLSRILRNILSGAAKSLTGGGEIDAAFIETDYDGEYSTYLLSVAEYGGDFDYRALKPLLTRWAASYGWIASPAKGTLCMFRLR
jgi:signal transduction histidine kinase